MSGMNMTGLMAICASASFGVVFFIAPKLEQLDAEPTPVAAAVTSDSDRIDTSSPNNDGEIDLRNAAAAVLRRSPDGHFWADAHVNGRSIDFMVDTGASVVALTFEDARKIGLDPARLDYRWKISTAGGEVFGASVQLDYISIGRVKVRDVDAMVLRDGLTHSLLGNSFMGELSSMEFRQRSLIIRQ